MEARALWVESPRRLSFRSESVGLPKVGEVLVKALYSGISAGTELLVYKGEVPEGFYPTLPTVSGSFSYPIKYGYALVGEVLEVGPGVKRLEPGMRVFAHHPHQGAFLVEEAQAYPLPEGLEPRLGVFAANAETALNGLWDASLLLGETLVVLGLGVVGLLVVGLAKLAGTEKVFGLDPIEARREAASLLGADAAFGPDEAGLAALGQALGEEGADLVIEASGKPNTLNTALSLAGLDGRVVVLSWYGTRAASLRLGGNFHKNRLSLKGSQVSFLPPFLSRRWDKARRIQLALTLVERLALGSLITHTFPLGRAQEAFSLLEKRPYEALQVVFDYD
jgi:2-desacetyl-2-hydroxyethyl bacteriochlorophyllide A dehydrogenase